MKKRYTANHYLYSILILIVLSNFLAVFSAKAQCPEPINCTPGNATGDPTSISVFRGGIYKVTLGLFSKTSDGATEGFKDFSCTDGATLLRGASYPITIETGTQVNENVRVWIDFNNDGQFDNTDELAFFSNNKKMHSGTVQLPASTVLNTRLRMRVSADLITAPVPDPCSTPALSQVEDYYVIANANLRKPVANFTASDSIICSGTVTFKDKSQNAPDFWFWDFGDGQTSTLQSPVHTYATSGTYTVKLVVSGANGSDTLTKAKYINYFGSTPKLPKCAPITTTPCCGYGIMRVAFSQINKKSEGGQAGYEDFSCSQRTELIEGKRYGISITTGDKETQDTKVWIDLNDDGEFTDRELMFQSFANKGTVNSVISIAPGNASLKRDVPLRMRVASDYSGRPFDACTFMTHGQVEDYTVIIRENTQPPTANFTASFSSNCQPVYTFISLVDNNVDTIRWDFGDGTVVSSTSSTYTYTYKDAGIYTVKMFVKNKFGTDSLVRKNFINYVKPPRVSVCTPATQGYCCGVGVRNVTFNTINNTTDDARQGYQNYTCLGATTVVAGKSYPVSVTTGTTNLETVQIWIDYNNNGSFEESESVFTSINNRTNHAGIINISTKAVLNTVLRMRVMSDYISGTKLLSPCKVVYGQAEDYSIIILENTQPPVAKFEASPLATCNGIVDFTDKSENVATGWSWDFGDGDTSNLQNPSHVYQKAGKYAVTLKSYNKYGATSLTKKDYVTYTGNIGLRSALCRPSTTISCCNIGIMNVTFAGINNTSKDATEGYVDFACSNIADVVVSKTYNLAIRTGENGPENVRVWIDWNNNAIFDANELVLSSAKERFHAGRVTVPLNAVLDSALRMRVISIYSGPSTIGPCDNIEYGQAEDYAIIVKPNTDPPAVAFAATPLTTCNGTVAFTDSSKNVPVSWLWSFGDGKTSTAQNPVYTYTTPGLYTVKLVAMNRFGTDSLVKTNYVNVASVEGPRNPVCRPVAQAPRAGSGIVRLSLGNINRSSSDAREGYRDFSCADSTSLIEGKRYKIDVTTVSRENVRVWVDFNDNGTFEDGELVFSSSDKTRHTGIVQFMTSVYNKQIRMRAIADPALSALVDPCNNLASGQAEDYAVTILPNTQAPETGFMANTLSSCNGTIAFTDTSDNLPVAWLWNFGDGESSTLQNPQHTYKTPGRYTVTLIATNNYGDVPLTKTDYVDIRRVGAPVSAFCQPATINFSANSGIFNVAFRGINHTSGDASEGYQDFTCTDTTSVVVGKTYPIKITTGRFAPENVKVWLDYNNNGVFETSEEVFISNGQTVHNGTITIKQPVIYDRELRMRVVCEYNNTINDACSNIQKGQAEDYSVIIRQNTLRPDVGFRASELISCTGIIQFTDTSANNPISWQWDFGDGETAFGKTPKHEYKSTGIFNVTLTATNTYGSSVLTKTDYITITGLNAPIAPSCRPLSLSQCCGVGIYKVSFANINKVSSGDKENYMDFTCADTTTIAEGATYPLEITTSPNTPQAVSVWIDYSNNGIFEDDELIYKGNGIKLSHRADILVQKPLNYNVGLRMRVTTDYTALAQPSLITGPCYRPLYGQVEDYTVRVAVPTSVSNKILAGSLVLYPNPSNGIFTIKKELMPIEQVGVAVYNNWGQQLLNIDLGRTQTVDKTIDISHYPKGIYHVRLTAGNKQLTNQIVVQ